MRGLFGIGNSSIALVSYIIKEKYPDKKVQILSPEENAKNKAEIILVPSIQVFCKNKTALEGTKASVFIFDTPAYLEFLYPIRILDAKKSSGFQYKLFNINISDIESALLINERTRASIRTVNIIPKLLNSTIPSILKPIMTFLYSVQNTEQRALYKQQIFSYFSDKKLSTNDLRASMLSITGNKRSFKVVEGLVDFIKEELAENVKKAIISVVEEDASAKSSRINKICSDFSVSSYDVKYLLKAIYKKK